MLHQQHPSCHRMDAQSTTSDSYWDSQEMDANQDLVCAMIYMHSHCYISNQIQLIIMLICIIFKVNVIELMADKPEEESSVEPAGEERSLIRF